MSNRKHTFSELDPEEQRQWQASADAEFAQLLATAVIVIGVALMVVGYKQLLPEWLDMLLGARPRGGRGSALLEGHKPQIGGRRYGRGPQRGDGR